MGEELKRHAGELESSVQELANTANEDNKADDTSSWADSDEETEFGISLH